MRLRKHRAGAGTPAPERSDVGLMDSDVSSVQHDARQDNDDRDTGAILGMKWLAAVCADPDATGSVPEIAAVIAGHIFKGKTSAYLSVESLMVGCDGCRKRNRPCGTGLSNRAVINGRWKLLELGLALADCHSCGLPVCGHPRNEPCNCPEDRCPTGPTHVWNISPVVPHRESPGQEQLPLDNSEHSSDDAPTDADNSEHSSDNSEHFSDKGEQSSLEAAINSVETAQQQRDSRTDEAGLVDKSSATSRGEAAPTKDDEITEVVTAVVDRRIAAGAQIRNRAGYIRSIVAKVKADPEELQSLRAERAEMQAPSVSVPLTLDDIDDPTWQRLERMQVLTNRSIQAGDDEAVERLDAEVEQLMQAIRLRAWPDDVADAAIDIADERAREHLR